eukprot:TRINITY_DN57609_c2_g1_i1.p1 TRINITY_DN57609_c2_g1~~TRINITY_DN57609_c2_g1_i1.p1  ORF type:complete len:109 (-),score=24.81 TRINITY_DN57609_c2_g1_i1:188-514(-)
MNDYVSKPIDVAELIDKVARWSERDPAGGPECRPELDPGPAPGVESVGKGESGLPSGQADASEKAASAPPGDPGLTAQQESALVDFLGAIDDLSDAASEAKDIKKAVQ